MLADGTEKACGDGGLGPPQSARSAALFFKNTLTNKKNYVIIITEKEKRGVNNEWYRNYAWITFDSINNNFYL